MLFIFMGPSCSGKSTLADYLKSEKGMQVYTGKDYLSLARNEAEAWKLFMEKLAKADDPELAGDPIIYVITEKSILSRLPSFNNAIRVKFTADLDVIKERFAKRMRGNLPKPVEMMLERQVNEWDEVACDMCIDTTGTQGEASYTDNLAALAEEIIEHAHSR
ncbi:MAG TPA: hypothetical protein PK830_10595 [Candidatus Atribacteria bacterium]|nr:hypothetical protein [Candidatus Atribacteria bacterium]